MGSQTLQTIISINARTGNGFSQVGATLTELGSLVNGISQDLINFGKESVGVYRDYEKSMKEAEVALSTVYGQGTQQLNSVMKQLDVAATEWAATTIFHTNDVGNAISEAAHAGWEYSQIMAGIPAAMQLAQAGGLDLSEAVDYIVKSTNAAGVSFEDMTNFIDLWTFAANSSASTIGEFGDAMLRMGSTMRFAGSTEELMTLIAVTANAGFVGSEAGTMIRNSMMRLIAPTDKAEAAMAQLGATSMETADIMNDEALAAANAELAAHGFSVMYQDGPQKGQLKNMLDIYRELYVALGDIAGGYENIDRNGDALKVLSAIFPTRTVTEALTLIRGAEEGYDGLYEKMINGEATGYGQYAAVTMMDTLNGRIETFESKVERLKQVVGGKLGEQLEPVLDWLGGIADSIAQMDSEKLDAIVASVEVLAGTGAGLMAAGGAMRLIGFLLTPAGALGMGLTGLVTAATAIQQLKEADFAQNFGNMELDTEGIKSYIQGIGADFKAAYAEVDAFRASLEGAVENYKTASTTFSEKLFTDMITNAKLTKADRDELLALGDAMQKAVIEGITHSSAASLSYWQVLFGGEGEAEQDPAYREIQQNGQSAYQEAIAEAEKIGGDLKTAMTNAFDEGFTEEEYQKIMSYVRQYNEAIARASGEAEKEQMKIGMQMWLNKAQTAGLDDILAIAGEATAARDEYLAEKQAEFDYRYAELQVQGNDAETLARANVLHNRETAEINSWYDDFLLTLWESQIRLSDQAENFTALADYAQKYLSGEMGEDAIDALLRSEMGKSAYAGDTAWPWGNITNTDRAQLGQMLGLMVGSMGGQEGIEERTRYYEETGNAAMADRMRELYAMEQLVNNFGVGDVYDTPVFGLLGGTQFSNSNVQSTMGANQKKRLNKETADAMRQDTLPNTIDEAKSLIERNGMQHYMEMLGDFVSGDENVRINDLLAIIDEEILSNALLGIGGQYDLERIAQSMGAEFSASVISDYLAMWNLLYGEAAGHAEDFRLTVPVEPEFRTGDLPEMEPLIVPIQPKMQGEDSMTALQEQGVEVNVGADATELTATIDGADGQKLIEYLDGDATELTMTIMSQDGKRLTEIVDGDTAKLAAAIRQFNNQTITVNITGRKLFARGGRATSESVFGEAGPEWAIPEEHSERTAELLNAARAASGFTWPDLLARFGGLNSNASNQPATLIYSPTINAADATGVEQVLREDKRRFEKWLEERKMRDEMEVYT